jgi:hypothetical protein
MLSFNSIGNLGRLGNQMFEYASLKGIAKNRKYDFCIPPREYFGQNDDPVRQSDFIIYDVFNIEETNNIYFQNFPVLSERMFNFDEEIFENCPDNVDLFGYFQCEKYFEHIEDEIRKDFTFKDEIYDCSKECFDQLFNNQEVISLHIRRGDYMINPNHPVQSLEYYQKALSNFDENIPVCIFSDDVDWCNQQEFFESDRFFISNSEDTRIDLCLMSMCTYHIIANSSYSWWGSYLAQSKKTVAPSDWFGDELKITKDIKDLYRQNWIVI